MIQSKTFQLVASLLAGAYVIWASLSLENTTNRNICVALGVLSIISGIGIYLNKKKQEDANNA